MRQDDALPGPHGDEPATNALEGPDAEASPLLLPARNVTTPDVSDEAEEEAKYRVLPPSMPIWANRSYAGPLPPPDYFREFNAILPGLAQTMVGWVQAELDAGNAEQRHRHAIETRLVDNQIAMATAESRARINLTHRGQIFAFVLALAFLVVSAAVIWQGGTAQVVGGTVLGTVDLVALVTVFILGRESGRGTKNEPSASGPEPGKQ